MKFQNYISFENHFFQTDFKQLPTVFALFLEGNYEHKNLVKKMCIHIQSQSEGIEIVQPENLSLEIESRNLFASKRLFLIRDLELMTKEELGDLLTMMTKSTTEDLFILSGAKMPPYFYPKVKNYALVLDIASEKLWEKQKRIELLLVGFAKEEGYILRGDALSFLFQHAPLELGVMEQELKKIFAYLGESGKEVTEKECRAVGICYEEANSWKMAESLLWGIGDIQWDAMEANTFPFYPFLGTLRYHCYLGLFLSQNEVPIEKTPYQRLRMLDKYRAKKIPSIFFKEALCSIYKVEKQARTRATSSKELLELLLIEIETKRALR